DARGAMHSSNNSAAGAMRDSLIYAAAICLTQCGRAADMRAAAAQARRALKRGDALERWRAACAARRADVV
ncbi:MAG: hypothetical protein OD918_09320, partial [Gammaproteobacteria bacterium]